MDLDALLLHYFESEDLDALTPETLRRGRERVAIDFGVEREAGRRFALWTLLDALGDAPPPAEAFEKEPQLRAAADAYLTAAWRMDRDDS